MNRGWLNLMGLARRSGRLLAGTETVMAALPRKQIGLVLAAADLSGSTIKRLAEAARASGTCFIIASTMQELGSATGCRGRGVYGITDDHLAAAIARAQAQADRGETAEGGVDDSRKDTRT